MLKPIIYLTFIYKVSYKWYHHHHNLVKVYVQIYNTLQSVNYSICNIYYVIQIIIIGGGPAVYCIISSVCTFICIFTLLKWGGQM